MDQQQINQLADHLRKVVVTALCTDHGHAKQEGGLACRTCARRADITIGTVLRELSEHIYVEGRAALTAKDDQLWHIRNADTDSWLDQLASAIQGVRPGAS